MNRLRHNTSFLGFHDNDEGRCCILYVCRSCYCNVVSNSNDIGDDIDDVVVIIIITIGIKNTDVKDDDVNDAK